MPDQILKETKDNSADNSSPSQKDTHSACQMQLDGSLKGGLAMAICCGAPLLLVAAVTVFGISLGGLANGFVSLAALLACPVVMYLMMRMMNKKGKTDG